MQSTLLLLLLLSRLVQGWWIPAEGPLQALLFMPSLERRSVYTNSLSPSLGRMGASSDSHPVNQFHLSLWLHLLLGKCCSSADQRKKVRSQNHFFISQLFHSINDFPSGCCLGWLFKLNIAANCIDVNLMPLRRRKYCVSSWYDVKPIQFALKIKCIYDRYEATGGCKDLSSAGLHVFGLQLEITMASAGKASLFCESAEERVCLQKRQLLCTHRDFSLVLSSFPLPAVQPSKHECVGWSWKIGKKTCTWTGNLLAGWAANFNSTQFLFQCSQAS